MTDAQFEKIKKGLNFHSEGGVYNLCTLTETALREIIEDATKELEAENEKMRETLLDLLWFEGNLDPYMYECDNAQSGELLKPFTNAREILKDCICKKCKGEGIVRVGYNGWDKNPCPTCKGKGYILRR